MTAVRLEPATLKSRVKHSVDPDQMQHYAAFNLGLHCLPMYPMDQKKLNNLERRSCIKDQLYQINSKWPVFF